MSDNSTHVYCTECENFSIQNDTPTCEYEEGCCLENCEDSMPISIRKNFKEKKNI